jgi:peptidoglycan/LPS O-acetylase OafA/YrhL
MERIDFLDGVRGCAIILVIVFHLIFLELPINTFSLFWRNAGSFMMHGVTLFFVLSGFLVGSLLLHNKDSKNYFKAFYYRRAGRILPLYYSLLIAYYILKYILFHNFVGKEFTSSIPDWTYPFFLQSIFIPKYGLGPDFLAFSWSLCVEEQFYLFAPLLIYYFGNNKLIIISLTAILSSFISRILLPGVDDIGILTLITSRCDSLFMGIILAVIYQKKGLLAILKSSQMLLYLLLIILFIGIILNFNNFSFGVIKLTWISLFFAVIVLIPLSNEDSLIAKIFKLNFLKFFGKYSYGIYLYHLPIFFLMKSLNDQYGVSLISFNMKIIFSFFSIIVILIISVLSYHFFEKHFIDKVHKIKYN